MNDSRQTKKGEGGHHVGKKGCELELESGVDIGTLDHVTIGHKEQMSTRYATYRLERCCAGTSVDN